MALAKGIGGGGVGGGSSKLKFALLPGAAELVGASTEPLLVGVAGTNFNYTQLEFADGATALKCNWIVPSTITKDIIGGLTLRLRWKTPSTTTTQNVQFQVRLGGFTSGDVFDSALAAARLFPVSAPLAVAEKEIQVELALSAADLAADGLAAGDDWIIQLTRDPAHANDTMTNTAKLLSMGGYEV